MAWNVAYRIAAVLCISQVRVAHAYRASGSVSSQIAPARSEDLEAVERQTGVAESGNATDFAQAALLHQGIAFQASVISSCTPGKDCGTAASFAQTRTGGRRKATAKKSKTKSKTKAGANRKAKSKRQRKKARRQDRFRRFRKVTHGGKGKRQSLLQRSSSQSLRTRTKPYPKDPDEDEDVPSQSTDAEASKGCPANFNPSRREECQAFVDDEGYTHGDEDARKALCKSKNCCWQPLAEGVQGAWCFLKVKPGSDEELGQKKSKDELASVVEDPEVSDDDTSGLQENVPNAAVDSHAEESDQSSTVAETLDCTVGDPERGWSPGKRAHCCKEVQVGCPPESEEDDGEGTSVGPTSEGTDEHTGDEEEDGVTTTKQGKTQEVAVEEEVQETQQTTQQPDVTDTETQGSSTASPGTEAQGSSTVSSPGTEAQGETQSTGEEELLTDPKPSEEAQASSTSTTEPTEAEGNLQQQEGEEAQASSTSTTEPTEAEGNAQQQEAGGADAQKPVADAEGEEEDDEDAANKEGDDDDDGGEEEDDDDENPCKDIEAEESCNDLDECMWEAGEEAACIKVEIPPREITMHEKVWLQIGWLVIFLGIVMALIIHGKVIELLTDPPERDAQPDESNALYPVWQALNGDNIAGKCVDTSIIVVSLFNFYAFTVATEAILEQGWKTDDRNVKGDPMDDSETCTWCLMGDPFDVNRKAALFSFVYFLFLSALRLVSIQCDPNWRHYNGSAGARYMVANVFMLLELFALTVAVVGFCKGTWGQSTNNNFNLLWLFFGRTMEILARSGGGTGVRRLSDMLREDGKLLAAAGMLGAVVWLVMSGLYFLTNKDPTAGGKDCPDTACWEAITYKYGDEPEPWQKFESIPSTMWFVLINLVKEHPLADAHEFFWQRVCVCIVCIFAMPIFAVPASILQFTLFKEGINDEHELEDHEHDHAAGPAGAGPGNPSPPGVDAQDAPLVGATAAPANKDRSSVKSEAMAFKPPTIEYDAAYGPFLTLLLCYGSIMVFFFYTAQDTDHSSILGVPVRVTFELFAIVDGIVAILLLAEWILCLAVALGDPNGHSYLFDILHVVDIVAWLPGIIHAVIYFYWPDGRNVLKHEWRGQWVCAACVLRALKMERYTNSIRDMGTIVVRNKGILAATFILSMYIWMIFSSVLYFTEETLFHSPDQDMVDNYGSVERTLWAEIINLHGEWPWADYSAAGKGVGTVVALCAILLFCIPIGVFGDGYRDILGEHREDVDSTYDRRPWRQLCRPTTYGLRQQIYDLFYAHLHTKPGERPWQFQIARGISVYLVLSTTMITLLETADETKDWFWEGYEEWFWRQDAVAFVWFATEYCCRILATDWRHGVSWIGFCDVLSVGAFAATLNREFRPKAFHPDYHSSHIHDDCMVLLRLLRLFSLESYLGAVHVLQNVVWLNRSPLIKSGATLLSAWFSHATLLYLFEKENGNDEMKERYRSILSGLQYSIVHLFGDYPESDYTFGAKVVHFFGIMVGIALVAVFTGIFSASFVNYVKEERQRQMRSNLAKNLLVVIKVTIKMQRAFRKRRAARLASQASEAGMSMDNTETSPPMRQMSLAVQVLERTSKVGATLMFFFNSTLIFNLSCTLIASLPELDLPENKSKKKLLVGLEFVCTLIFSFDLFLRIAARPQKFLSRARVVDFLALFPGYLVMMVSLGIWRPAGGAEKTESRLFALCMFRAVRIVDFPYFRRETVLLERALRDAWGLLAVPTYLAVSFWVVTSALFMWLENFFDGPEKEHNTSVPDAMYWCCIYLTGEWANVDFSFMGSRLSIVYVIFGIAVFSIPVGIIVEAIGSTMKAAAAEEDQMRALVRQRTKADLRLKKLNQEVRNARRSVWDGAAAVAPDTTPYPASWGMTHSAVHMTKGSQPQ
eukprot:TRINITY_DN2973_c0_g1_i1.p1 TRINITY_DN2973_c0_g1~~TRINITY_DN2973_c0_g1_i1.p1  ORF type:complete len:1891 (-),score=425.98 TRINITY_DN2973_c0_g1_i1:283-5955(-)